MSHSTKTTKISKIATKISKTAIEIERYYDHGETQSHSPLVRIQNMIGLLTTAFIEKK